MQLVRVFDLGLGDVLGASEFFGVGLHLKYYTERVTVRSQKQLYIRTKYRHSSFSMILTGGRPCQSLPRLPRGGSSPAYSAARLIEFFLLWLMVLPPTQKVPRMSFLICLQISNFLLGFFSSWKRPRETSMLFLKLERVRDLICSELGESSSWYRPRLGRQSVLYICSLLASSDSRALRIRCTWVLDRIWGGFCRERTRERFRFLLSLLGRVRLSQRLLSLEMRWSMQLEQSLMSWREDSATVSRSSIRCIGDYIMAFHSQGSRLIGGGKRRIGRRQEANICEDHEQLSGRPTSRGEMLVLSPMNCLRALIVLKSRCTRVQTPCCQLPFSTQVQPQTSLLWALLQGMLLLHFWRHSGVAHRLQSEWPSGKPQAPVDSMKVQEERRSLICQLPSVLVNICMLKSLCRSMFFSFTSTDPVSPMSREEEPGNWSSWQSSWMAYRSEGIGQPQRGNSLGQSDSQIFTLKISSSERPCCLMRLAKLEPKLQGLSSHISSPFSPPMITSRQVTKSSGILPPKLALNLAQIAARLVGEMCLAASILKPEKPMPRRVVKQSAILCLTYSVQVFRSARLTSHPQLRMKPSVQELRERAQWKSLGPQGTAGSSIPGLLFVTLQFSQAYPWDQKGEPPLEFLLPQQLPPEQWLGNMSFPFPTMWFTTASAYTRTPFSRHVFIMLLSCSGVPMRECSLQLTGWQTQDHGFSSPFSGCSKSRMASEGGNTLTPMQPALPIISHSSAMSSQGQPNISMMAPFWPFLKLLGWFTVGWFQMKSRSSRTRLARFVLPSQAYTRTERRFLTLLATKKLLESDALSPQKYFRVRELKAGLRRVTTVTLAPPEVQVVRAYPTRMLQSWQLSLHRGSPLAGVWNARLLQEASLSVWLPLQAFSLSKLLQESLRREQEKGETTTARQSSAARRAIGVVFIGRYNNKSYISSMNSIVRQYLKAVSKLSKAALIAEGHRLGVHINQKLTREEAIGLISQLSEKEIEEHLAKKEAAQQRVESILRSKSRVHSFAIPKTQMSPDLNSFWVKLNQIHEIHLNQFSRQYYLSKNISSLPPPPTTPPKQSSSSRLDELLGVRTEIFLEASKVNYEYQYPIKRLESEVFPQFTEQDYEQHFKSLPSTKIYINQRSAKDNLLLRYGLRKEEEFLEEANDHLSDLLYREQSKKEEDRLIENIARSLVEREKYYGELISAQSTGSLCRLIRKLESKLISIALDRTKLNHFTLTFAEAMLRSASLLDQLTKQSPEGNQVLEWVLKCVRAYCASLEFDSVQKVSASAFLSTLKKYQAIKQTLSSPDFPAEISKELLLGTNQREWPDKLVFNLDVIVAEVGVGELGGKRVADRLQLIKDVVQFTSEESVELNKSLLDKLLFSINSGLEWHKQHPDTLGWASYDQTLYDSELAGFFDLPFCMQIIKLMFVNVQASIETEPIIHFFWQRFMACPPLTEEVIQHLFLLINLTIRYKLQFLLEGKSSSLYSLLDSSIDTIYKQGYEILQKQSVLNFIQEEATLLLQPDHQQKIIDKITSSRGDLEN